MPEPKTQTEPLPRSVEDLVAFFKSVIVLPCLEEIRVTPKSVSVRRLVEEGEPVLPRRSEERPDPPFVLGRLELDHLPFDPEAHPLLSLLDAMGRVTDRNLRPSHLLAPEGPWVAAYVGLPGDEPPSHLYGMEVLCSSADEFEEKMVVVGTSTGYLEDARFGVVIDMGA